MNVAAIVVLFNPSEAISKPLLECLAHQCAPLVIVDNSPRKDDWLLSFIDSQSAQDFKYIHFAENVGVAVAQNAGLKYLLERGCEWACLFDQDSAVAPNYGRMMWESFQSIKQEEASIIAIGPQIICRYTEKKVKPLLQRPIRDHVDVTVVSQIISSGMFLSLTCLPEVGLKDERLFIDGVDHEWCWRAALKGFHVGIAKQIHMQHYLGDGRKRIFGIPYKQTSERRLYYQFRNIILLSKRDYVPRYWKLRNLSAIAPRFLINALLETSGKARCRFMLRGLKDGLKGVAGPLR
ncbi:glycosyltransferase family 2 protein [Ningiella sp. W23]|uniref:glycosyltransferase family 2 protein n=1 Tax=Ningiella sp. W23 TaxID=3023715 RepID=UPI003758023C